ncbi:MAG: cation:proton antiporter subunit C [Pseudomonadota bacterium]
MTEFVLERSNYWAIIGLMMIGLYIVFQSNNLIKRLVGLSVFQTSIFLFYITLSKVAGGTAPILYGRDYPKTYDEGSAEAGYSDASAGAGHGAYEPLKEVYSNPLPHVLILTAIVVGVATLSVGLAIIVRIREAYGTIESDDVRAIDQGVAVAERDDDKAAGSA